MPLDAVVSEVKEEQEDKAVNGVQNVDPADLQDWLDALDALVDANGPDYARRILSRVLLEAQSRGAGTPAAFNTPYVNSIPAHDQPKFPGDRKLERRIKSLLRWNAMAMVARGHNGGHISTYASAATLYEVGFNHFFKGKDHPNGGDLIYFQGHASPGIYARAFLEGRLTEQHLHNFRKELAPEGGLSSYPHPWLMPQFWQFPTVSMGLGPLTAIYQARFNRYLEQRGLAKTAGRKIWCFIGDGETDEPETLGSITLAAREKLDNLIFVINCNLQRLDGPVRGNGKVIQELEAAFRGAGWHVLKVIWGGDWDALLARDDSGVLVKRMGEVVDGEFQKYAVEGGAYMREHFFGKYPELLDLVSDLTDDDLRHLKRGGHDPLKVYAAYKAAVEHTGSPVVILAHTVKGYGLGVAGEARNTTHQQKKMTVETLKQFRARFHIPVPEGQLASIPFYRPPADSPELKYLNQRRKALGGPVPARSTKTPTLAMPSLKAFEKYFTGSGKSEPSTTVAFVSILNDVLLKDKHIGKHVVPIIPDEARTFGMDPLFKPYGIYSSVGQLYEPVDAKFVASYREATDGQILEEGITEAGAMSSFIAAGSSYSTHGVPMIPFFIYYSMFGFQRIGDLIWSASDQRCRGFLLGATAGRTTLNGEGLQHQDGHSPVLASTVPTVVVYDPAYAYELAVIIQDGMRRMYEQGEDVIYYLTLYNENYAMPAMPEGAAEGILKGLYKFRPAAIKPGERGGPKTRVHLFGSGVILNQCLRAQELLAEKYHVAADVWSVTSYKELRREAQACERWNLLHPTETPRKSYLETVLAKEEGVFVAASDYMKSWPELIQKWVPGGLFALGTDGFGRSDDRPDLRRHFEVDAECIAVGALNRLAQRQELTPKQVQQAIQDLGIDADKADPMRAESERAMATEIKLPMLSESVSEGAVLELRVKEGSAIKEGETLLVVEAEKSTVEVPSPVTGKLSKWLVKKGEVVKAGQSLARAEASDGQAAKPAPKAEPKPEKEAAKAARESEPKTEAPPEPTRKTTAAVATKSVAQDSNGRNGNGPRSSGDGHLVPAGPATRRLARKLGVDLERVPGSGPRGRITQDDVIAFSQQRAQPMPAGVPAVASLPDFAKWGPVEPKNLELIRRKTAEQMSLAWSQIPHVTQHDLADVTDLEAFRKTQDGKGPKLTVTAFALKAVVVALKEFPHVNASLDAAASRLILKRYYHIGVAVDTERGLLVPVIRDVDRKSVRALAAELTGVAEKARQGKLPIEEMKGGTFTITNLGGIGGVGFTPIVNWPEVAILGLSRARLEPVVKDGQVQPRLMLPLSLSYDHRVVDGADGARFTRRIAAMLENPLLLLVDA